MVHHAIYYKQNYSYFGIIEALSGAPFSMFSLSARSRRRIYKNFDVVISVGDADTAQSGGEYWVNERSSLQ
ncbi:MAG: lacto-N-biose phosphorylase central domain-containing protein [Clostridia bacterium]